MRTTIRLNPELARRAKEFASRHRRTFTQLVEEALSDYLQRRTNSAARKPVAIPVGGDARHKVTPAALKRALEEADLAYDLKKLAGGSNGHP